LQSCQLSEGRSPPMWIHTSRHEKLFPTELQPELH
jgi:hypothetical protein